MLGIVEDTPSLVFKIGNALADHAQIFLKGRFEDGLDMQRPGLADEGNDCSPRIEQCLDIRVSFDWCASPAGRAERGDRRLLPLFFTRAAEELGIFGVRAGPS